MKLVWFIWLDSFHIYKFYKIIICVVKLDPYNVIWSSIASTVKISSYFFSITKWNKLNENEIYEWSGGAYSPSNTFHQIFSFPLKD